MENVTCKKLLESLSEVALEKLSLVPTWVQKNRPEFINESFEVLEGGQIALVVRIGEQYIIKIFVPKFSSSGSYEISKEIIQNYSYLKASELDLSQLGITSFEVNDEILRSPILVIDYYKETEPLVNTFYKLDSKQKKEIISKLVLELKKFNQPVHEFKYSTKRILDKFDDELKKHESKIPFDQLDLFKNIRVKTKPRIVTQNIVIAHTDIHLENVLVGNNGNLKLIDFDFCHFAPRFCELEVIFLFCFLPTSVVPEELEHYYSEPMTDVYNQINNEYPELCDPDFENEIKLLFATQIIPKLSNPKFSNYCLNAIKIFF
jgi:thiamine kinase-like enzyme